MNCLPLNTLLFFPLNCLPPNTLLFFPLNCLPLNILLFLPPGCLPLLIQLLHGSDKEPGLLGNTRGSKAARARAAAALHNIVHSHPDDKRGRREARVLRLLEQLRAHCDQLKEAIGKCGDDSAGGDTGKTPPGAAAAAVIFHIHRKYNVYMPL